MYEIRYGNGFLIGKANSVGEAKRKMLAGAFLEPVSGNPVSVAGLYREDGTRIGTLETETRVIVRFARRIS